MRFVVFTDLDGTLLDHDTYDWAPARPMIERLRDEGSPLVFVTSKTRAEVEVLRGDMGVDEPFVVENGAAAFFPTRYDALELPRATRIGPFRVLVFGRPYTEIRGFVEANRRRFSLEGFGDMSLERIRDVTGLSAEAADLAQRREFTEPFLLNDPSRLDAVERAAAAAGLSVTTGGRFHHLMGAGQDKGQAVRAVHAALERATGTSLTTIGLGDGPNDVPMLEAVDAAVLIPAPGRPLPEVGSGRARVAPAPGPNGWTAALEALMEELGHDGSLRQD